MSSASYNAALAVSSLPSDLHTVALIIKTFGHRWIEVVFRQPPQRHRCHHWFELALLPQIWLV